MTNYFVPATLIAYAASLAQYIWYLYAPKRALGFGATACLAGGLVLHYFALLVRSRMIHGVPYDDLPGSLSLFAWLLAATYLGLELWHGQRTVGAFVLPVVLFVFIIAHRAAALPVNAPPGRGPIFAFHVTLNILAYAAFALSFVTSLIYLIQDHLLRDRKLGSIGWRFPALDVLERVSRSSVGVGLVSLAIGASLGFVWAHRVRGGYWQDDWKVFITLLILAAYLGYLILSRTRTWRGARASRLCVANFLIVIFSYSIVNLFLSRFHRFF
ncbi:MAG: cytochrome c biogenesis protein [Candidatus Acidiferrales bacterium]